MPDPGTVSADAQTTDPEGARLAGAEPTPDKEVRAYINEVFLSFQGEGVLAGARQIFLRLAGCDIRCPWCDTPEALVARQSSVARFETYPDGPFRAVPNPLTPDVVAKEIVALRDRFGPVEWISLTGGEPLIWRRYLEALCPLLKKAGFKLYIETNSRHPSVLESLSASIDFVSADVKLPFKDYPIAKDTYRDFLSLCAPERSQVKIVLTKKIRDAEVIEAAKLIAEVNPGFPLILQPVTSIEGVAEAPSVKQLLRLQRLALAQLRDVRIIPQLHPGLAAR